MQLIIIDSLGLYEMSNGLWMLTYIIVVVVIFVVFNRTESSSPSVGVACMQVINQSAEKLSHE